MAREGFPFIGACLALALAAWGGAHYWSWAPLMWLAGLFAVLGLFVVYFFRDPRRNPPEGEGLIVSAADGKVVGIEALDNEEYQQYLGGEVIQLSIFLSPLDVHINRVPAAGVVDFVKWHRGKYLAAFVAAASTENEQSIIGIDSGAGRLIVKQIVGVVARRIVCYLQEGDRVERGERFGLIRFGSRVDFILPAVTQLRVQVGDRVRAGETIIGVFS